MVSLFACRQVLKQQLRGQHRLLSSTGQVLSWRSADTLCWMSFLYQMLSLFAVSKLNGLCLYSSMYFLKAGINGIHKLFIISHHPSWSQYLTIIYKHFCLTAGDQIQEWHQWGHLGWQERAPTVPYKVLKPTPFGSIEILSTSRWVVSESYLPDSCFWCSVDD